MTASGPPTTNTSARITSTPIPPPKRPPRPSGNRIRPPPPAPRKSRTLSLRRKSRQRIRGSLPTVEKAVASLSDRSPGMNGGRRLQWPASRDSPEHGVKLVEEYRGVGALRWRQGTIGAIAYRINRYQGMALSGLPVPGVHRIEGTITFANVADAAALVGADVTLDLEDGRSL